MILPPLLSAVVLVVLALALTRVCCNAWARRRARPDQGALPEQPLFPPPSHHERLQDPGYLRKIIDRDRPDSRR